MRLAVAVDLLGVPRVLPIPGQLGQVVWQGLFVAREEHEETAYAQKESREANPTSCQQQAENHTYEHSEGVACSDIRVYG